MDRPDGHRLGQPPNGTIVVTPYSRSPNSLNATAIAASTSGVAGRRGPLHHRQALRPRQELAPGKAGRYRRGNCPGCGNAPIEACCKADSRDPRERQRNSGRDCGEQANSANKPAAWWEPPDGRATSSQNHSGPVMRVMIVGASGLIGSAVAARLASHGNTVVAVARTRADTGLLPAIHVQMDVAVAQVSDWLPHLRQIDAVVNCAGILQDTPWESTSAVHADGAAILFQACDMAGVIIHLSAVGLDHDAPTARRARSGQLCLKVSICDPG
jgi:hypothetical protein